MVIADVGVSKLSNKPPVGRTYYVRLLQVMDK